MASSGRKRQASVSLQDAVAETLECPVCLETIKDPPVFLCSNGHELCQKCREPMKAEGKPCPVCQDELLDIRNRFAEKMLKKLPKVVCKHEGKTFARSNSQIVKSHEEKECRMKLVKCELCQQPIALSQLFDHEVTIHERFSHKIAFGEEKSLRRRVRITPSGIDRIWTWQLRTLVACNNDCKFFINLKNYDTNLAMCWVSFCGTQMEAEDYEYTIKIKNSAEKRAKKMYLFFGKSECVSCDVSYEDLKKKGSALFLYKDMLESAAIHTDGEIRDIDLVIMLNKN